jgi:phage terminase Nu1 subunit (DNA packaging protein)
MDDTEYGRNDAAKDHGVSPRTISEWAVAGMPQSRRGKYLRAAGWIWRWKRDLAEVQAKLQERAEFADRELEDALLKRTMREIKEFELRKLRGELLESRPVLAVIERAVGSFKTKMLGIPSKIAGRVVGLEVNEAKAVLDADIYEALNELARIADDIATLHTTLADAVSVGDATSEIDGERVGGPGAGPESRGKRRAGKVADRSRRVPARNDGRAKRSAG